MKQRFRYGQRSAKKLRERAEQAGSRFDSIVKQHFKTFSPKEGDSELRILPPTWDLDEDGTSQADHWGYTIFIHYGVGPDNQTYLCPWEMNKERCPVCDERRVLARDEDTKQEADQLRPVERCMVWVVNRKSEDDGPMLWPMPLKIDSDLASRAQHKKTGEILYLDDPEEGYDIDFTKSGKGIHTQYTGMSIARDPSPLSEDRREKDTWLNYVLDNPVPDCLNFYDYDYIKAVFAGVEEVEAATSKAPKKGRTKLGGEEDEEDQPEEDQVEEDTEEQRDYRPPGKSRRYTDDQVEEDPEFLPPPRQHRQESPTRARIAGALKRTGRR